MAKYKEKPTGTASAHPPPQRIEIDEATHRALQDIRGRIGPISISTQPQYVAAAMHFQAAAAQLLQRGFAEEVERHVQGFLAARTQRTQPDYSTMHVVTRDGRNSLACTPEARWWLSLVYWAECERDGEQRALRRLPELMLYDSLFFLAQPWVQQYMSRWHEAGDEEKLHHAFFGKRGRGSRSFTLAKENTKRDLLIYGEVAQRIEAGQPYSEAIRQTTDTLNTLGITEQLSVSSVQRIYDTYHATGETPLDILFTPRVHN